MDRCSASCSSRATKWPDSRIGCPAIKCNQVQQVLTSGVFTADPLMSCAPGIEDAAGDADGAAAAADGAAGLGLDGRRAAVRRRPPRHAVRGVHRAAAGGGRPAPPAGLRGLPQLPPRPHQGALTPAHSHLCTHKPLCTHTCTGISHISCHLQDNPGHTSKLHTSIHVTHLNVPKFTSAVIPQSCLSLSKQALRPTVVIFLQARTCICSLMRSRCTAASCVTRPISINVAADEVSHKAPLAQDQPAPCTIILN